LIHEPGCYRGASISVVLVIDADEARIAVRRGRDDRPDVGSTSTMTLPGSIPRRLTRTERCGGAGSPLSLAGAPLLARWMWIGSGVTKWVAGLRIGGRGL
jgi:hypothetical protein